MYECGQIAIRTHDQVQDQDQDQDRHTSGTQDTSGKERNTGKAEKPEYICMFAGNEKKVQKKLKKIWK